MASKSFQKHEHVARHVLWNFVARPQFLSDLGLHSCAHGYFPHRKSRAVT